MGTSIFWHVLEGILRYKLNFKELLFELVGGYWLGLQIAQLEKLTAMLTSMFVIKGRFDVWWENGQENSRCTQDTLSDVTHGTDKAWGERA